MIKVLDLFAGTQSVRKALTEKFDVAYWTTWDRLGYSYENGYKIEELVYGFPKKGYEAVVMYIGVDIYSPEDENLIFDLAQENVVDELKTVLGEWTPDVIWASPVCNKFSTACAYKGGNLFFERNKEEGTIKVRTVMDDDTNKKYWNKDKLPQYQEDARLALKLHENTKKIVDFFNVPFAIENPRMAMSKYLYKDYINNYAAYCQYGFKYEKPTTIYSNKELNLNKCNHKDKKQEHSLVLSGSGNDGRKTVRSYTKRSAVPSKLIQGVLEVLCD